MAISYHLFDTESMNLIGNVASHEAALTLVRHTLAAGGPPAVRGWALERQSTTGAVTVLATGDGLLALALGGEPVCSEANC